MKTEAFEQYCEVRLRVPHGSVDAICSYITDNITQGLVIEEEEGNSESAIMFYVPGTFKPHDESNLRRYISDVLNRPIDELDISTGIVKNIEWVEQYRKSVKAVTIAGDVVVRPQWAEPDESAKYEILLDPGMAFGTGTHETTRSCLAAIRKHFKEGNRFLDIGCGSGILSILADKMSAGQIKAIDNDIVAIENCRVNFAINEAMNDREILFGSIELGQDDEPYEFVCANIIKSTILPMLAQLLALTCVGGMMVLSGLLEEDETEVAQALANLGEEPHEILRDNNWITIVVRRN